MRSIVGDIEEKMYAWIANMRDNRKETTACHEATETDTKKTEVRSRNDTVRSGASRDPRERSRSDARRTTEEVT
jgi:hypothetical protein